MTGKRHILVVDDHATNRKLVARLLDYEGYRISEAADGAEGLDLARRDTPDLVISDILMPSMDGYEFVRRLRADPTTAGIRVMFYTANYHEREAQSLAAQVGVSRVIVKPCPAPALVAAVTELLSGDASPPAPPPEPAFDVEHLRLLTDKLSQSANALRASNSRLAALTRVNLQMASEHDPRQMLRSVCASARALFGARFAVLSVLDKPQTNGAIQCISGMAEVPDTTIADPREDQGILGQVFRERAVHRLASRDSTPLDLGLPAGYPQLRSALMVPVCSLKNSHGWLCLADKVGADEFSAEDENLLAILGAQLGRIYENGSLYREVQDQATQLMIEAEERSRAVELLQASEERFRELAENIQDVFFVASADMRNTTYISPGYERIWGRPVVHMLERDGTWMDSVHADDRERVQMELGEILRAFPAPGRCEFRMVRPDDTVRWVLTRIFPIVDERGQVVRTVGVSSDITERKLAELRILRLNRTYAVLSGINSLIVRATDRDTLLDEACRLAVNEGQFQVAWCGLLDEASRELRATASAGNMVETAPVKVDQHAQGQSAVIDALRSGQPQICNDLAHEDARTLFRERYLEKGYRSLAALPLTVAGKPAGCLVLLADVADYFDEEEMRLLVELAGDISFALDHIGHVERLDYLARFDALTGLPNRRTLEEHISQYIGMASRSGTQFAVMVADPEHFQALNNTLGRTVADEVLRQSARRFAHAAGGPDLCGHIGSDQFAAIIPVAVNGMNGAGISRLIDELWRDWLGQPFIVDGHSIELTAKAGISLYRTDGATAEELLNNAIAALRSAKESGRKIGFYTRDLGERIAERLSLERALRHALENNEFRLHYQPKVDLAGRHIVGLEALLRWQSPDQGLVSPDAFIPVLEETGMIVEVGAWVLRQACLDHKRWLDQGLNSMRIAVNVSAVQLARDDFVRTVGDMVQRGGDCGLDIEVTETVLMTDVSENLPKLNAIRDFGVGIALDDFGTGYSSMAYLAKLPVGVLKIDRSFISAMLDDPSVLTLVSTIISLSQSLKLVSVAEGVETEDQAKLLRLIGCDQMQGYLISKPLPFDEITVRLRQDQG